MTERADPSDGGGETTGERDLAAELARERAAREEAERLNRLKDQFIAMVSHELRAPLTTLLLWEKVLRDEHASAEVRAQALDAIHHSTVAQSRLVGDLLDVARAISGKLSIDRRQVDLRAMLADVVGSVRHAMTAKQLALAQEIDGEDLHIEGDAFRVRQIVDNLVSNAIKFTDPGGRITIRCQRDGGAITIAIADTGRGIRPEILPTMFEPFSQDADTQTAREGLGLGLAISRQLAVLHGGTLDASSPGPGLGSTFTITLPWSHARQIASPPRGRSPAPGGGPPLAAISVLMIDDDARVRHALSHLLRSAGATVTLADGAARAREELGRATPDAILCDLAMPEEDGFTFMEGLRASGSRIPAIALTAHASAEYADRASLAGFDVHLAKPIHLERLVATIAELIRARRESTSGRAT